MFRALHGSHLLHSTELHEPGPVYSSVRSKGVHHRGGFIFVCLDQQVAKGNGDGQDAGTYFHNHPSRRISGGGAQCTLCALHLPFLLVLQVRGMVSHKPSKGNVYAIHYIGLDRGYYH